MLADWGQHQEVCLVFPALGIPVFEQNSHMPQSFRVPSTGVISLCCRDYVQSSSVMQMEAVMVSWIESAEPADNIRLNGMLRACSRDPTVTVDQRGFRRLLSSSCTIRVCIAQSENRVSHS